MEKLRNLWENKTEGLGKIRKDNLLIALLIGILLIVISLPVKEEKVQDMVEESTIDLGEDNSLNENSYESELEEKLSNILQNVDGVGKVNVMITLKSSRELIVEKDIPTESKEVIEEDGQGGTRSTKEEKITQSTVYVEDEVNGNTPYVVKEIEPEIEGVVVLAQGANNPEIVNAITEAVQALFSVETHKIKVMKMN